MTFKHLVLLVVLSLSGCSGLQNFPGISSSGQMPDATTMCSNVAKFYSNVTFLLQKTYNPGNSYQIQIGDDVNFSVVNASYNAGVYQCEYSFPESYITTDSEYTYTHQATFLVGVQVTPGTIPGYNTPDLSGSDAQVTMPLKIQNGSDVVTQQIKTATLNQENQDAQKKANEIIQDTIQYDKEHPCLVWQDSNNVLVCLKREGEF